MSDFLRQQAPLTMALYDRLASVYGTSKDLLGQYIAGQIETFGPGKRTGEEAQSAMEYAPAIANILPLIAGGSAIGTGYLANNEEMQKLGGDLVMGAVDRFTNANENAAEITGVGEPTNFPEMMARMGPAPIKIPVRMFNFAKPESGMLAKTAQGTGNLAVAALLPGTQMRTPAGVAGEFAAGGLLGEGITALGGPLNREEGYQGLLVDAEPEWSDPFNLHQTDDDEWADPFNLHSAAPSDDPLGILSAPVEDDDGLSWGTAAAVAGVAFASSAMAAKVIRQAVTKSQAPDLREGVGTKETELPLRKRDAFGGALLDENIPTVAAVRGADPDEADIVDAQHRTTVSLPALAGIVKSAAQHGYALGFKTRIPSIDVLFRGISKVEKQRPNFRQEVDELLVDQSQADRMKRGLRQGYTNTWKGMNYDQLEADILARRAADPVLARFADTSTSVYHGMARWLYEGGMITKTMYDNIMRDNPRYAPLLTDEQERLGGTGFIDKAVRGILEGLDLDDPTGSGFRELRDSHIEEGIDDMLPRNLDVARTEGQLMSPLRSMENRLIHTIRRVNENKLRRRVVDALAKSGLAKKLKSTEGVKTYVPIYREGNLEHWEVPGYIHSWMKFQPGYLLPLFNAARRVLQETLTGRGNPGFVPIAQGYEALVIAGTRQPGRSVNYLELLASPLRESPTMIAQEFANNMVQNYRAAILAGTDDSGLMSLGKMLNLDEQAVDALANRMGKAFEGSLLNMARSRGALTSNFVTDNGNDRHALQSILRGFQNDFHRGFVESDAAQAVLESKVIPESLRGTAKGAAILGVRAKYAAEDIWAAYGNVLRDLHFAPRMSYLRENIKNVDKMSDDDMMKLMRDVQEVAGNPAKAGRSLLVQIPMNFVAYVRPTVQGFYVWADSFAKNGVAKSLALASAPLMSGIGYVVLQSFFNEDFRRKYWEEQTALERHKIPLMIPGVPDSLHTFQVEHVFNMVWAPAIEAVGHILGFTQPPETLSPEQKALQIAATNAFTRPEALAAKDMEPWRSIGFAAKAAGQRVVSMDLMNPALGIPMILGSDAESPIDPTLGSQRFGISARERMMESVTEDQDALVAGADLDARVQLVLERFAGLPGRALAGALNAYSITEKQAADEDQKYEEFFRHLAQPYKETIPFGSVLFGVEGKVSGIGPEYDYYKEASGALNTLSKEYSAVHSGKVNHYPQDPRQTDSPEAYVRAMGHIAATGPLADYRSAISSLYNERASVMSNVAFISHPDAAQREINRINKQLREEVAKVALYLRGIEREIGKGLKQHWGKSGEFSLLEPREID